MDTDAARAAIYYPHTGIRTTAMLKEALLLWDHVEYIAPYQDFQPDPPRDFRRETTDDGLVRDGLSLVLVRHVPSEGEQDIAHETISRFVESDLAERLRNETVNQTYLIYPGKFPDKTWKALEDAKLAKVKLNDPDGDYEMPSAVGLVLMSVLAEACAGSMRRTVTDQHAAYSVVRESILRNMVSHTIEDQNRSALVDVTLKVANIDNLSLEKLIGMRKREAKQGGQSLRQVRHKLVAEIDTAAKAIVASPVDKDEIQRQFESDMADDLSELNQELGDVNWKALFSRELAVGMLSTVGFLSQPVGQMIASAVAALGIGIAYRRERRAALVNHAMSWLYLQRS